jgi:hypothetical protein
MKLYLNLLFELAGLVFIIVAARSRNRSPAERRYLRFALPIGFGFALLGAAEAVWWR